MVDKDNSDVKNNTVCVTLKMSRIEDNRAVFEVTRWGDNHQSKTIIERLHISDIDRIIGNFGNLPSLLEAREKLSAMKHVT